MRQIKVAVAVMNQTPFDWEGNLKHILQAIQEARNNQVGLLCLPELCITGYGCEDMFHSPMVLESALDVLADIVPETEGMVVSVGLPLMLQNAIFNTACLMADGRILGFTAKRFLAGDGIHYEHRWFKPWPEFEHIEVKLFQRSYPVGDLHYDCGGIKIGFEICEDAWVAKRPGTTLTHQGVDLILNPSASHFAFHKIDVRKRFVQEGSRAFSVSYLYSNLLGNESGRTIYDGGGFITSGGELIAIGPRFSFQDVQVTSAVIDIDLTRMRQSERGGYHPEFDQDFTECIEDSFIIAEAPLEKTRLSLPDWEESSFRKEEEFTRAITLALFDYLRKSRSGGFVISLSGGADSTAVATLCSLMIDFAWKELGETEFKRKLSHLGFLQNLDSTREIKKALISTVYQATRNSSETTRDAAETVANAIHSTHYEWNIDALVDEYQTMISASMGLELTWEKHDLALQNIQARTRGPSVWMLANVKNALLLATSNRSEAAVGYATMDGDTCGGISPIAGIDKAFLRQWLKWLANEGPSGFSNIKELHVVANLAPTAELRPQSSGQTDEGDLMPYEILDAIERAAIRDKQSPTEIDRLLQLHYPQTTTTERKLWIRRFFQLWCRNQWKRERYAPTFHVDDENLDPKSWCRFPILCSGFQKELEELERKEIED